MQALTKALEVKIAGLLPDRFGQVFDGWSNGGVHYIATFAAFHGQPEDKPILLAFSPVDNEQDLTAMSHYDFLVDYDLTASVWFQLLPASIQLL